MFVFNICILNYIIHMNIVLSTLFPAFFYENLPSISFCAYFCTCELVETQSSCVAHFLFLTYILKEGPIKNLK